MTTKEKPWACPVCNQLNSEWAEKCGRCEAPMRKSSGRDEPEQASENWSDGMR